MNSITIITRLGRDFEARTTPNGTTVAESSVPIESGYGERKRTTWAKIVMFGQRAKKLVGSFSKGDRIAITGKLEFDQWQDRQTGEDKEKPSIVISDWSFVEPRQKESAPASEQRPIPQTEPGPNFQEDDVPF
jgi:single-strand DNA-binding protein